MFVPFANGSTAPLRGAKFSKDSASPLGGGDSDERVAATGEAWMMLLDDVGLVVDLALRFERDRGRALADVAGDCDSSLVIGEASRPFKNLA